MNSLKKLGPCLCMCLMDFVIVPKMHYDFLSHDNMCKPKAVLQSAYYNNYLIRYTHTHRG